MVKVNFDQYLPLCMIATHVIFVLSKFFLIILKQRQ